MKSQYRVVGVAIVGGSTLIGAGIGLTMPRFPATAIEALTVIAVGLGIGLAAGFALRSRWALLATPLLSVLGYHLGRLMTGVRGPTIDRIALDTTYGVLAFVLGFVVPGLLGLLPMLLGASLGAALARRRMAEPPHRPGWLGPAWLHLRRGATALTAIGLILLAVSIARPASTPPLHGDDGEPIPGSVASLEPIQLGGHEQWIMIRAAGPEKPVLLYLSGGPGQSDLPFIRVLWDNLARDFVVVDWDQRGTGKSYPALEPTSTLTVDQLVADTIELTDYLRRRFGEEKIYLTGESWGTTLGVLAVQRAPERYHAFIGSGQMVSQLETDRRLYRDVLALAARTGSTALADKLHAAGEPPYNDVFIQGLIMEQYEDLYGPYEPPRAYVERGMDANLGPWGILGSEYTLIEKVNLLRATMEMNSVVYPWLGTGEGLDFRRDVPRLALPYYMLDGQAELRARRDLALEWYAQLDAPIKRVFTFENAAHSVSMEQFEAFHRILLEVILPETYPNRDQTALAVPASPSLDREALAEFFDELVPTQLEERGIPGAAVTVVRDGAVVFSRGYGWADVARRVPVVADQTLFHIGSNTKLFTWTAVMQLVEQGRLDLDADVNRYLDFLIPATYPEPITLRHLLAHTAGFENRDYGMLAPSPEAVVPLAAWVPAHLPARVRSPGQEVGYSNYGTALAGYVVERVTGVPYEDYIEQQFLRPLDMQHSTVRQVVPPHLASDVARGYVSDGGQLHEQPLPTYQGSPAGAIRATATDVGQFMLAHLQDGRLGNARILEEDTARTMRQTLFRTDPRLNGMAHGFWEMDRNGVRVVGHIGSAAPFHYSLLALLPDERAGLFVVYNSDAARPLTAGNQTLATFMDHFYPAPAAELIPASTFGSRARQFTGEYQRNTLGGSETTVEKVRRVLGEGNRHVSDPGDGTLVVSGLEGRTRFVETAPDFFREIGGQELVLFQRDARGAVTRASFGGSPAYSYERLSLSRTPGFNQGLLIVTVAVFVSTLLAAAGARVVEQWRPGGLPASGLARAARWAAGSTATLNLVFLAGLVVVLGEPATLAGDFARLRALLVLPLLSIPLTGVAVICTALAWWRRLWSLPGRLHFTMLALASAAFVWFLSTWNLLGFHL